MDLSGSWRAAVADEDLRRVATDPAYDDAAWATAAVPGHWRTEDPFSASDGPLLYRRTFDAPELDDGQRCWLTFDGLCYQGDVWLDGTYLGDTEGYFTPHTFEITSYLAEPRTHLLAVEVASSPVRRGTAKRALTGTLQDAEQIDPNWNPGGIWRPVRLERSGPVRIARLRSICTSADEASATISLRAELLTTAPGTVTVNTAWGTSAERSSEHHLAAGINRLEWTLTIDRPRLWWPWSLGEAALDDLKVSVDVDGATSDTRTRRMGLRRVSMHGFVMKVNGERLFLKGCQVGPGDRALGSLTTEDLVHDVQLARSAGLDLLRVHAHVSRPELYAAADELGMLVWQDLPMRGPYARSVRRQSQRQASDLVNLLGHHPSIVLWCGHDAPSGSERELSAMAPLSPRTLAGEQVPNWNRTLLDRGVKRALSKADRSRPVLAHSGVLPHFPQIDGTDAHLWFGWYQGDERDLGGLLRTMPRLARFVTGFGAQSVPPSADFCMAERWPDLDWDHLEAHHGLQRDLLLERIPPHHYGDFDSWADATRRYQAEVVRRSIETLRRLKYQPAGGFAHALLADSQQAISWSLLDHRREAKAAYHALSEACRPLIVVADRTPSQVRPNEAYALDIHVVSDLHRALDEVRVKATLSWDGGEHQWAWTGALGADTCERVGTVSFQVPESYGMLRLDLDVTGGDHASTNRYEVRIVP